MSEHNKIKPRNFLLAVLSIVMIIAGITWINKPKVKQKNIAVKEYYRQPMSKRDQLMYSALTCLFTANKEGGSHEEQKNKSDACFSKEKDRINGTHQATSNDANAS